MLDIIVIVMLVAFVVWLITQLAPLPPSLAWLGKVSFIVLITCMVLLLSGVRIGTSA